MGLSDPQHVRVIDRLAVHGSGLRVQATWERSSSEQRASQPASVTHPAYPTHPPYLFPSVVFFSSAAFTGFGGRGRFIDRLTPFQNGSTLRSTS